MTIFRLAAALLLATLAAAPAIAAPRQFGDSVLFSQSAFTDEITGEGPDLVLVTASAPEGFKPVIRHLRANYRVHLIVLNQAGAPGNAEAVDAWLARRHWTPVLLAGDAVTAEIEAAHAGHVKKVVALSGAPEAMIAALESALRG